MEAPRREGMVEFFSLPQKYPLSRRVRHRVVWRDWKGLSADLPSSRQKLKYGLWGGAQMYTIPI